MRLNRFLASAGLGSRRSVEELIKAARVKINGRVVTDLATQVAPEDSVKVGSRLVRQEQPFTVLLNKPRGYLCTASDELDRKTIFDLFPAQLAARLSRRPARQGKRGPADRDQRRRPLARAHSSPFQDRKGIRGRASTSLSSQNIGRNCSKGFHIMGGRAKAERVDIAGPQTSAGGAAPGHEAPDAADALRARLRSERLCRDSHRPAEDFRHEARPVSAARRAGSSLPEKPAAPHIGGEIAPANPRHACASLTPPGSVLKPLPIPAAARWSGCVGKSARCG